MLIDLYLQKLEFLRRYKLEKMDALESQAKQLISFMVGNEEYGLEILKIKEVIRLQEITRLPKAPSFVKGVINLRGDVIPVIDLREKFGLESKEYTNTTRVIVVEVQGKSVGMTEEIVFDRVGRILDEREDFCRCQNCVLDLTAYVLNHVTPQYKTSLLGKIRPNKDLEKRINIEIDLAIKRGIEKIKKNPHHET